MNNFKSCAPCVCTSSGHKQVCQKHDITIKHQICHCALELVCYFISKINDLATNYDIILTLPNEWIQLACSQKNTVFCNTLYILIEDLSFTFDMLITLVPANMKILK